MKHLIDIDTKVSRDTYRRYKYLDTAHLCTRHYEVDLYSKKYSTSTALQAVQMARQCEDMFLYQNIGRRRQSIVPN